MTARQIALLQRKLLEKCGGVHEASKACGLSTAHLYRCQDPTSDCNLTIDRLLTLAIYAADASIFHALAEAVTPGAAEAMDLRDAAVGATLASAAVLSVVSDAVSDGPPTPNERETIRAKTHDAGHALRLVTDALDRDIA